MNKDIKSELEYLKNTKRKEVREKINNARQFCDFNEDATYKDFIDEQYRLEERIQDLENKLHQYSDANTLKYPLLNHQIKIVWLDDQLRETYCLVNPLEADVDKNYLSVESPLGKVLVHTKENEVLKVDLPNGVAEIKVLEIKKLNQS